MSTYLCYPVETKHQETEQMASSVLWPPHTPSKKGLHTQFVLENILEDPKAPLT